MPEQPEALKIWCLLLDQDSHVLPVEHHFGTRATFVRDRTWNPQAMLAASPSLVLCVNEYPYDVAECLLNAKAAGIPTLCLQDGILEWRCQYENPLFGAGGGPPQHQPVLADKIACIGAQSARQIAAWGNRDKVEVCGMPRLDHLLSRSRVARAAPGTRILVMTAKKPGFDAEQVATAMRSLCDLRDHLAQRPNVQVLWRTRDELARSLGVDNSFGEASSMELADLLDRVDAVITTPSTAMLEAMLLDRPVAVLDYHNRPRYVPSAWTISSREHINSVVAELLSPPTSKLAFQRDCLHDCLACDGPAAPKVGELIERMIERKVSSLPATGQQPRFIPPLAELYPQQAAFEDTDLVVLQSRFARLQRRNQDLEAALRKRSLASMIQAFGRQMLSRPRRQSKPSVPIAS